MKNIFLSDLAKSPYFIKIQKYLESKDSLHLSGVYGSFLPALLVALHGNEERSTWIICEKDEDCEKLADAIRFWGLRPLLFTRKDFKLEDPTSLTIEKLISLGSEERAFRIVSIEKLFDQILDPIFFVEKALLLKEGEGLERSAVIDDLIAMGYIRVDKVRGHGEFAIRGDVFDIYPSGGDPVRIDLSEAQVDFIKTLDIETYQAVEKISSVKVFPTYDTDEDLDFCKTNLWELIRKKDLLLLLNPMLVEKNLKKINKSYRLNKEWFKKDVEKKITVSALTPDSLWVKNNVSLELSTKGFNDADSFRMALDRWKRLKLRVILIARDEKDYQLLQKWIKEHQLEEKMKDFFILREDFSSKDINSFISAFEVQEAGVALGMIDQSFPKLGLSAFKRKKNYETLPVGQSLELKEGDYVIHLGHGIAKYDGLHRLENDGIMKDYIKILFKGDDALYVPIEQMDLIQKYIGLKGSEPKLHKLGGYTWGREKKKAQVAIENFSHDLLKVQARRNENVGFAYKEDKEMEKLFRETFPYSETEDQEKAILDVYKDMTSSRPMDRLICGDVGYGKTEVAIRATFRAVMNNKQVMLLVPTTLLAFQHFRHFEQRMKNFPIKVEMLSRFRSREDQKEVIHGLADGQVDIVIGTHRLLQKNIEYKDLGLLIIDEEQRFGVAHKEKIKKLSHLVDVLVMSATPIPRTLYMSLTGMRDISLIQTPPLRRLPVHTEICFFDKKVIKSAIRFELERGGQVFFLHNRVKNIQKFKEVIEEILPEARVVCGHGQMDPDQLEEVMIDFLDHKYDVLISTTIIESGLDIPNVNTIIINDADLFGLSTLYQLRGRVGRYKKKAYAYLMVDPKKCLTRESQERLHAIKEYSDLGSGYQIAMRDLEIRGGGNVLGAEQSGHIARIGFDMYCSLLRKYTKKLKGEPEDPPLASVDLKIDIFMDPSFISNTKERLEIYRSIASVASEEDLKELEAALKQRYGDVLPDSLLLFMDLLKIRIIAGIKGYRCIVRRRTMLDFIKENDHKVEKIPPEVSDDYRLLKFVLKLLGSF
ncbi:transcription-repair coupling factor [PVC group bacterium (ex Bugula neritina AB1)]|nr:transcription-repair coupling factor [PVC group bacterium (ex Bugula neritina AB1)]